MVNEWVKRYLDQGIEGLEAKKPKVRDCYLSPSQQKQLSRYIEQYSVSEAGGRLTGESIRVYIQDQFDVSYHPNAIYKLLKSLGFSWITSRSKHPQQSQAKQDAFKKVSPVNDPSHPI